MPFPKAGRRHTENAPRGHLGMPHARTLHTLDFHRIRGDSTHSTLRQSTSRTLPAQIDIVMIPRLWSRTTYEALGFWRST